MDTLHFILERFSLPTGREALLASPAVSQRRFAELIREVELPFASREGHPEMAGGYIGLELRYVAAPSRHLLGEPVGPYGYTEKVTLLQCVCGEAGCWSLLARITLTTETLTWSDFEQPHRGPDSGAGHWRYDAMRPLVFARSQYEAELQRLADCLLSEVEGP